jgi:hypothetical protein
MGNLNEVELYNNGSTPIYLPQVGISYSTTPIPLASLTQTGMPPASFTSLIAQGVTPGPHGIQLNPGQSVVFKEQSTGGGGASSVPALSPFGVIIAVLLLAGLGYGKVQKSANKA